MKPVLRSVNLVRTFQHSLSRSVVPHPCVAEYTGGLTKFGTPTTPRGDNFSGTADKRVRRTVDTPQDSQRVVNALGSHSRAHFASTIPEAVLAC
jgi:hypothetical protein